MDPTTQERRERVLAALADPGFTPGRRDLPILLEQLAREPKARRARVTERAILRMGAPVEDALLRALARDDAAPARLRQRLIRVLARLPQAEERPTVRAALTRRLEDPEVIVRRAAALALGKLAAPASAEADALLQLARRSSAEERARPELVRACVEALGKCGGDDALAWMATLDARAAADPELARLREQAALRIKRTSRRDDEPTRLDDRRAPPEPVDVIARCRPGLSDILKEELEALCGDARALDSSRVLTRLRGPLRALWGARSMLSFAFPLPVDATITGAPGTIQDAALAALGAPRTRALVETWTEGQAKFRVAWARGGSRRAETWALAAAVSRALPWFPNDPTQSPWELVIDDARGPRDARFELRPRGLEDPRFAYRVDDVPAASHPTIAAALARVSGASPDDIVWDPFAGSGLELIERGLLAPYRRLIGSDLDDDALTVARRNLEAAGVTKFELRRADARRYQPGRNQVTSIITNPPMGRRVARGDIGPLLDEFLVHAAGLLAPGGRLTWLSPLPKRTRRVCEAEGLTLERASQVDMGGFTVELQRWRKRRGHR